MPNKGSLAQPAQQLIKVLGFENGIKDREYTTTSKDGKYRFLLVRARDIPAYVESKVADLGITGLDIVTEQRAKVVECMALPFGFCSLVYAVPKNNSGTPRRVATAFPNLASAYLSSKNLDAEIICLDGAIEASVPTGIADAIFDITSTGKTLEANGLQVADTILESRATVITTPEVLEAKREALEEILSLLRGDFKIRSGALASFSENERRRLLVRGSANSPEVVETVREIFDNVRKDRDEAITNYANKFDKVRLSPRQFQVPYTEIKEAYSLVSEELIAALKTSAENIARFSKKELPSRWEIKTEGGLMGKRIIPLDSVGVYAPGGTAAYPSSVLMGVVPARVAGVSEIVLSTPCNVEKKCNPAVLVAADIAGASKVFRLGGAQAIAAMAYGTRTVPKVMKVVGPGNTFVAAAKLEALSRGLVSIDSPAGPSEVLIVADETANPVFVAADLLAQAEHDVNAAAILVTTSAAFAESVEKELRQQIILLERKEMARKSLSNNGAILLVSSVAEAIDFVNEYAPEHLELVLERPFTWLDKVRNAGAVFLGNYSCEAAGDYAAGPNHVLPTAGAARMYSGLSAKDFVREMNYLRLEKPGLAVLANTITTLAKAEGLTAHGNSVKKRFEGEENV